MTALPGTWRRSDGSAVAWSEAVAAWSAAGRTLLRDVASTYNDTITYADFATAVQDTAGIETRSLLQNWIGDVLVSVAQAQPTDEPTLTALVIRADGTIGPGYGDLIVDRTGVMPMDLDWHSAEERLACYRFFGARLPLDGGRPTLTAQVARRRTRERAKTPVRGVCPACGLRLPASGRCDRCDPD